MKRFTVLLMILLLLSFLVLPIIGDKVVIPNGVFLLLGIKAGTAHALLGLAGIVLVLMATLLPALTPRLRYWMTIGSIGCLIAALATFFLHGSGAPAWKTFTQSKVSDIFYVAFIVLAYLFVRQNTRRISYSNDE